MALQEPVLRAVKVAFEWPLPPRFPDVRGAVTEVLIEVTEDMERWFWDSTSRGAPLIVAWNDDRRLHITVEPNRIEVINEGSDLDGTVGTAESVLARCLEILGLSGVKETEISATWMLAAESAKDAEDGLETWLFSEALRTKLEPLGGRPDDLILSVLIGANTDVTTRLRTEPLTDRQAANSPYFLTDFEASDFPPAAVVVDLERAHKGEVDAAAGIERAQKHLQQVLSNGAKLLATVANSK